MSFASNEPPGTPGPKSAEMEVRCVNDECEGHDQIIVLTGTREYGSFFPDGPSDDRMMEGCEFCQGPLDDV